VFGLVKNIETYNPFAVALGEYWGILRDVSGSGVRMLDRLRYLLAAPGFSHDMSRKDSRTIKADFLREHPEEAGTEGLNVNA
jgi:hypothetical protein